MNRDSVSQLEQFRIERLLEIGHYLQTAREERQLTLEQVSARTLIQARLLRAIETGKLNQLPEPVYIQGFIRRYAEALDLDGAVIAESFPAGSTGHIPQPTSWKASPAAQLRPVHLYFAYVLLIMAAVSGLSFLMSRSNSWVNGNVEAEQAVINSPQSGPTTASAPAPANAAPSLEATLTDKPVQVNVTLTAQSWLRVEVDGKTDFQGILPEGTERTWMANSELKVRAGNAGGVRVSYNNGQPEFLGAAGEVKEITFTAAQEAASLPALSTSSLIR